MPEAPSRTIRLLLVDDHALLLDALSYAIREEEDFEVAGLTGSVTEALELVGRVPVDVVLLDVDLGGERGGDFLEGAEKAGFRGKVIIVTAGVDYWEGVRLLRSGASAIFLKQDSDDSLFQVIRDVAAGRPVPSPVVHPSRTSEEVNDRSGHRQLTARQRQVLRLLVEGKLNKEIAADLGLRDSQVKEAFQGLFLKTGVRTRAQLVRLAIERYWGEVLRPQDPGGDKAEGDS